MRVLLRIPRNPPPKLKNAKDWDANFVSFIEYCLAKDPAKRPTAAACMQHAFIQRTNHIQGVMSNGTFVMKPADEVSDAESVSMLEESIMEEIQSDAESDTLQTSFDLRIEDSMVEERETPGIAAKVKQTLSVVVKSMSPKKSNVRPPSPPEAASPTAICIGKPENVVQEFADAFWVCFASKDCYDQSTYRLYAVHTLL